ncbi:MAG: hypothetical protein R3B06_14310 [Kofleriaceae bacterium]
MARDYRRAATIYDQLCDRGRGALDACVALVEAIVDARGVTTERARIVDLSRVLCERGDLTSCFTSFVLDEAQRDSEARDATERAAAAARGDRLAAQVAAACQGGDGRACEVMGVGWGGDGSSVEARRLEHALVACRAGRMDACGTLAIGMSGCGAPEVADVAACEARSLAAGQADDYDQHLVEAVQRLRDACGGGDARACAYLPSQRLSPATLCAAHDYGACAELGCLGDDAASAAAAAHGVERVSCAAAERAALGAWKRQPGGARFPPVVRDGAPPIGARATPPWQAVQLRHHGGRDRHDWPRFDAYNVNDRPLTELAVCMYAYDGDGNQLLRVTAAPPVDVAPDARQVLVLDVAATPALPDGTAYVAIDYDHVRFAGEPPRDDGTRCPARRPSDPRVDMMRW